MELAPSPKNAQVPYPGVHLGSCHGAASWQCQRDTIARGVGSTGRQPWGWSRPAEKVVGRAQYDRRRECDGYLQTTVPHHLSVMGTRNSPSRITTV